MLIVSPCVLTPFGNAKILHDLRSGKLRPQCGSPSTRMVQLNDKKVIHRTLLMGSMVSGPGISARHWRLVPIGTPGSLGDLGWRIRSE